MKIVRALVLLITTMAVSACSASHYAHSVKEDEVELRGSINRNGVGVSGSAQELVERGAEGIAAIKPLALEESESKSEKWLMREVMLACVYYRYGMSAKDGDPELWSRWSREESEGLTESTLQPDELALLLQVLSNPQSSHRQLAAYTLYQKVADARLAQALVVYLEGLVQNGDEDDWKDELIHGLNCFVQFTYHQPSLSQLKENKSLVKTVSHPGKSYSDCDRTEMARLVAKTREWLEVSRSKLPAQIEGPSE